MKVSIETLSILKSFASINPTIYLGDPKAVIVNSPNKGSVVGVFQPSEKFDHECVFWEWPLLLSTIDAMGGEKADLDFQDNFIKIVSPDKASIKYFYTSPLILAETNPPPKKFVNYSKEIETDFEFEMSTELMNKIIKLSRIMKLTRLDIIFEDGKGKLVLVDDSNTVSHNFEQELDGTGTGKISLFISTMNIISGNYQIQAKTNLFAKFINKDIPLFYLLGAKASAKKEGE